ncbi:hypothetical protein BUALT_Bualt01G0217300 [Buddleja alternifolia]|uniref:Glyoxylate/hydroxypyruvate reductase HPR3 n=1 Tax=Buddleja alternifolia TaxID=168488 RepID=A0AAV6YAN6_9LAMI|nr:hypothetical protein BUALT_Bualt01G0217300 [Buddleja alternifolia]
MDAMAGKQSFEADQLPQIIVFGPPTFYKSHDKEFSSKFRVLKPWQSQLPLPEFLTAQAKNIRAALCSGVFKLTASILRHLPSLELVVSGSVGLNHIDLLECRRRGIAVATASTLYSGDVAELAVGLLLDVLRKISAGNRFVRNGLWLKQGDYYPLGSKLEGKQVGIVGLGSIGQEVAKRLEPFGCTISYHSRNRKLSVSYKFQPNIHQLATTSDILIICCALNEETRHMINRDVLLALGNEGVIVNVARGAIIDERELVWCLEKGEIAGAGLDVFENEPYVPQELRVLDNVVLSPHVAVLTVEASRDFYELASGNLEAFFSNQPLLSLVPNE